MQIAFGHAGLDWKSHLVTSPDLLRPAEVDMLVGDAGKARSELGWSPRIGFKQMIEASLGKPPAAG